MEANIGDAFLDDLEDLNNGTSEVESEVKDATKVVENELDNVASSSFFSISNTEWKLSDGTNTSEQTSTLSKDIYKIVHVSNSSKCKDYLTRIKESNDNTINNNHNHNMQIMQDIDMKITEDDLDYRLIIEGTEMIKEIDDELDKIVKCVQLIYSTKFPELFSLISNKKDYIQSIMCIGNQDDMANIDLSDILPSASVMIVSVSAATSNGQPLNEDDFSKCMYGCDEYMKLDGIKREVLSFIESRMSRFAPNICELIGPSLAATLISLTGGLIALSRIPSGNLEVVGQIKGQISQGLGFSSHSQTSIVTGNLPHTGILFYCDLIQAAPAALQRKMLKIVSGKVALAARVDAYGTDSSNRNSNSSSTISDDNTGSGSTGRRMKQEILAKLEKLTAPDKARVHKALPVPIDEFKKKRAGKRVRRQRERMGLNMTDTRLEHNKISMNGRDDEDYDDVAMGLDKGMIGQNNNGKVRKLQSQKISFQSKKTKKMTSIPSSSGGFTSGMASTIAFTPVQGMELVNPAILKEQQHGNQQKEGKVKEANAKWFAQDSGFLSAIPK